MLFMPMKKSVFIIVSLLIGVFIYGCAAIEIFKGRDALADSIAKRAGFNREYINAGGFRLLTYQKFSKLSDTLTVYIEGDGRAWESKCKLSSDPTPLNPIALKLAAVDPAGNIAYIARPGQHSDSELPDCEPKYWSESRFSQEVIDSFNKAVDILKESSGAGCLELVGYSGGGALAVFIAVQRNDVMSLRTVAGNLNTDALSEYHHVSYLRDSLNPVEAAQKVAYIPQRHFIGSKDKIIPLQILKSFVRAGGDKKCKSITVIDSVSHSGVWQRHWRRLLLMPLKPLADVSKG